MSRVYWNWTGGTEADEIVAQQDAAVELGEAVAGWSSMVRRTIAYGVIVLMVIGVASLFFGCTVTAGQRVVTASDGTKHTQWVIECDTEAAEKMIADVQTTFHTPDAHPPTPPSPK